MDRVIILDADMASAFAKIKRLELLKRLFSKHRIVITPEIYEKFGLLTPDRQLTPHTFSVISALSAISAVNIHTGRKDRYPKEIM